MKKSKVLLWATAVMTMSAAWASSAPAPVLYQEYPQPGEDQEFAQYAEEINTIQETLAKGNPIGRAFHAKAHGCLTGTFTVNTDIPDDFKYGVFVPGAQYPLIGRFSNASGRAQKDKARDLRGLALKLELGKNQQQDFLLTNGPIEFVKTPAQFMQFARAGAKGLLGMAGFFLTHLKAAKTILIQTGRHVASLTTERFWSRTPFKIGPKAMKFNVVPCSDQVVEMPKNPSDTYLTDDLRERAAQGPICYEFRVQLQKDPVAQPIEDPTVEWLEKDTESVSVARVVFDQQTFDSSEQMEACQAMSFSPWHNVSELQPIGGLNRARRYVYPSSAGFRGAKQQNE